MKKIRGRGCGDRSLSKNHVQVGWLSTRIVQLKPFKMPRNTLRIYRNILEKYLKLNARVPFSYTWVPSP